MKKKVIPSKGLFAISIVCFIMSLFFVWIYIRYKQLSENVVFIIELLMEPSFFNILMSLIGILVLLLEPLIFVLLVYFTVSLFLFAGRPVKFSKDTISLGYIKKKYYYKKNITGIGVAPKLFGRLYTDHKSTAMGIYIAFGDYRKSDFSDYGIPKVWEMVELKKLFPKLVDLDNKYDIISSQPDCSKIQVFDGLLWMTYTEENMRFLQNWLGSKFDEVTQR